VKEEIEMESRMLMLGAVVVALALVLGSCSQNPEQNPIIQEKFQKIAELVDQVDQIKASIKDTNADMDTVKQDLTNLKQNPAAAGGVSPAEIEELKSKVKNLEDEVSRLQSALSIKKKSEGAVEGGTKTEGKARKTEQPAPREKGVQYKVKEGDTLESIAKAHGTTAAAIRAKNPIPEGKEPRPGSMIFVPTK
jgi:outer membrane murein-binding lipoprotein Lpp